MGGYCFPKPNPNPLAPPWWFPSEWTSETPAGYRDEFQMFTLTQALTANQVLTAVLPTDTSGQCNFYWRMLGVFLYGGIGVPAVRIRDSEGYMMMNTRVALANGTPFGNQDAMTPILVAHRMTPGAELTFDLAEETGNPVTVLFMIIGNKRWTYDPNLDGRGGSFGPDSPFSAGKPGVPGAPGSTGRAATSSGAPIIVTTTGGL
jgi:hypothetical protein